MMALQMLLLLQIVVILMLSVDPSRAYAVYGTKRYGRSSVHRAGNAPSSFDTATSNWAPYHHTIPSHATQRYPSSYYELYPYSQTYPDDYYYPSPPRDSYPVYYPPARTSKYEVYQAVMPYYYSDSRPMQVKPSEYAYSAGGGGGYDSDPVVDLQEEMIQEAEREEREESQPIGHELLYENDDSTSLDDSFDDVNAAFLQNLIMSQMYKDAIGNQKDYYYDQYPSAATSDYYNPGGDDDGSYLKWDNTPTDQTRSRLYQEDEDVRELKQLAKAKGGNREKSTPDDLYWFQQRHNFRNLPEKLQSNNVYNNNEKRTVAKNGKFEHGKKPIGLTDRKPIVKSSDVVVETSTSVPNTSEPPKRIGRGQKEQVLMRPATPVRHPFSEPLLEMMTKNDEKKKRAPSVYDTIKHMLDMEKSLENKYGVDEIRPNMKKRIISSEESLTHQLSVLKKSQ